MGSLVLPVVAGAAVVSAPVVVAAAVVSAPVVVVAAAVVVADAVVFSDEPPRSTVARPAIGYKYRSGLNGQRIKEKTILSSFFYLAGDAGSDLGVGGALGELLPPVDEGQDGLAVEDEELLPDSCLLLDDELVPGVTARVCRDPADLDVLAVPALEHAPRDPLPSLVKISADYLNFIHDILIIFIFKTIHIIIFFFFSMNRCILNQANRYK